MPARWIVPLLLLTSTTFVSGCGDGGPQPKGSSGPPGSTSAPANAGASNKPALRDKNSAEAAVTAVLQGLQANRPLALWEFLPPSYRADLNNLVHHLARTADPELWKRTFEVFAKLVEVVQKQRQLIAEAAGAARPEEGDPAIAWLQVAGVLDLIVRSELAEPARVAKLDLGEFLGGTGEKVMRGIESLSPPGSVNPFRAKLAELSRVRVTEIKSTGDRAAVSIEVPGHTAEEVEFVRVEEKWIPRDLADGWIEHIGRANAMISTLSAENLGPARDRLLALLKEVEETLDKLGAARDREQFVAALQAGIDAVQKSAALFQGAEEPTEAPAEATGALSVAIVVKGQLEAGDRLQLLDRLSRAAFGKNSGGTAEYTADDATTIFRVSPVTDLEAFVKSLDFLSVTEVDAPARRVSAKLKR